MQRYDSKGRYAKYCVINDESRKSAKKEKARQREIVKKDELFNRAQKSRDPLLMEVFWEIEKAIPGEVIGVNEIRNDKRIGRNREFDIIAKKSIIEVKSGTGKNKTKQFYAQRAWAYENKKEYYIYAPNIASGTYKYLIQNDFKVFRTIAEMIQSMKEVLK